MRFLVHYGRTFTVLLLLFPLLGVSAWYLYVQYQKSKHDIVGIVQESMIEKKHELLNIYVEYLRSEFDEDFIHTLKTDDKARVKAEKALLLMKNSEVQYLYLLYIDEKDHLRYLIDTTEGINEKGEFQQRFLPQKDIWKKAQEQKQIEVTAQREIDKLWISMAYPIVIESKTVALLGIDFSHKEYLEVNKTLIPLENIYIYSVIFILVMLTSAFVQLLIYYKHRKKSFIDPLTGMYNRQYLHELLKKTSLESFQILIMDLDHFKQVNDLYGHDAGDIVLSTVSERIQSIIRKKDILIRYGGEEFLLLIAEKDIDVSMSLAQRVREYVKAEPIDLKEFELKVTISMGLNPNPGHAKNFEQAIKVADQGLYKAKQLGRDRVEVYDDEIKEGEDTLQKMCDVKEALQSNQIFCAYQPIFDTQTLRVDKYELLIRMRKESDVIIAPAKFLPSIRYTQLYIDLTRSVLEQAFEALGKNDVKLSINLDMEDLFNDDVLELFLDIFKKNPSFAQRLSIEVLEHKEIMEFELISQRLSKLQKLGVKIAIDDFGSGYANYKYMLNMNIDILKIDGSLISGIDKNESAQKVVNSIHILAKDMGIKTVAEHVETKEEFECIKALGIDYVQGYYLAKPALTFLKEDDSSHT